MPFGGSTAHGRKHEMLVGNGEGSTENSRSITESLNSGRTETSQSVSVRPDKSLDGFGQSRKTHGGPVATEACPLKKWANVSSI